jgi:hypothetical protein
MELIAIASTGKVLAPIMVALLSGFELTHFIFTYRPILMKHLTIARFEHHKLGGFRKTLNLGRSVRRYALIAGGTPAVPGALL